MKQTLIQNIGILAGIQDEETRCLCGDDMQKVEMLKDAWLLIEDGMIKDFGKMSKQQVIVGDTADVVDAQGGALLPSFCDSHTHLVYADSREQEFVDKIRGLSYAEIARRGGGILNSADRLHERSEEELYQQAMQRVEEIIRKGTGAVEIKSGYGLNTKDELKMLRVIRRIRETSPIKVVSTFLGAHAVARGMQQADYVNLVINEMIPEVGRQGLADFIDVFCDKGFFTYEETVRILEAGDKWGLRGKIHGQELDDSGGVEAAVRCHALSVDHLESMTDRDICLLKEMGKDTIPTVLPGTSFFLNMPYAPARKMIEHGLPVALASDYNPGSTPSGDIKFVVSLACIKMRLLPGEAMNAATLNSACAMGLSDRYGSITRGKVANFLITEPIPSLEYIPYAYTKPLIRQVFLNGEAY
jgi:imidazolonepropionase